MKQLILIFILLTGQHIFFVGASTKLIRDCEILKGIYDSYKINNFRSNCCDMTNIKCKKINSEIRMTELDLSNTNISEIPSNIVNLEELSIIKFIGNNINGEIPLFFNQLKHLKEINLSRNRFYGQIPKTFLDIKNLTILDISGNRLFGIIPSGFCDMENLKDIRYHDNMNGVYPCSCIKRNFGYSLNNFVRYTRWIVFIGMIVIIISFGILNLIARQNQIKARLKRLSRSFTKNNNNNNTEIELNKKA